MCQVHLRPGELLRHTLDTYQFCQRLHQANRIRHNNTLEFDGPTKADEIYINPLSFLTNLDKPGFNALGKIQFFYLEQYLKLAFLTLRR